MAAKAYETLVEKMVESHPQKGDIVRPMTLQNTKAMFESMRLIELGIVDISVDD